MYFYGSKMSDNDDEEAVRSVLILENKDRFFKESDAVLKHHKIAHTSCLSSSQSSQSLSFLRRSEINQRFQRAIREHSENTQSIKSESEPIRNSSC